MPKRHVLLAICVVFLAVLVPGPGAGAATVSDPGEIAFSADPDGNSEIYVVDLADGSEENLTADSAYDGEPNWSPFGTAMAFVSDRSGVPSLLVSALDGSEPVLISAIDGLDWAWSPDGRRIAWVQHNVVKDLWVTDIETRTSINLTNGAREVWGPSWSPDGRFILLEGWSDAGSIDVFRIAAAAGGGAVNLTAALGGGQHPQWSPDGAHIAFSSYDQLARRFKLYVINADGTRPHSLIEDIEEPHELGYGDIAWSPDGAKLAYAKQYGSGPASWVTFFVVNAAGGVPTRLLDGVFSYGSPSWSADGTRIAIEINSASVTLVDPDGTDLVTLTGLVGLDETRSLSWSPDGSRLAFEARLGTDSAIYLVDADGTNPAQVATGSSPSWKPVTKRGVGLVDPATGQWYLEGETSFYFGIPGDVPVLGDWDCDGVATPGVWRQSSGLAYLRNSLATGIADESLYFGVPGDIPLAGDWDGDGCDSLGVYRNGTVFLRNTLDTGVADIEYDFGMPGDQPFVGDIDADGVDEIGLYRPGDGMTYLKVEHSSGPPDTGFAFAIAGDYPIAGDWDGDGVATVGVFRPADHQFLLRNQHGAGPSADEFWMGRSSWIPVAVP